MNELAILNAFWQKFVPMLDRAYEQMEKVAPEKTGEVCPECGGELVYRKGKYGRFISCSNFPKCRYTRNIEETPKEKPEPTGKICPECGGELLKRRSRYNTYFLGCSNYPSCRHMETLDGEPIAPKGKSSRKTGSRRKTK